MSYDNNSRKQDAAAHNAEIGFVVGSSQDQSGELARHLTNVMNMRRRPSVLDKLHAEKKANEAKKGVQQ